MQNDITLKKLKHAVHSSWPTYAKDCDPELKDYWSYHKEISLEDRVLFKDHRLIVPKSKRWPLLEILHTGHHGIDKMTLRARESVFWPGILNDIKTLTETCTVCQENSKSQPKETQQQTQVPLHMPGKDWA